MRPFKRAIEILREEGIIALAKALLRRTFRPIVKFVHFLSDRSRIRKFRHCGDLNELVDFVNNQCHGYIRPIQVRSEILELLTILDRTRPRFILEIGTASGGTLFLLARIASKDARIVSIDLPDGGYGLGYRSRKIPLYKSFALPGQAIHIIRADSHNWTTLEKVKAVLGDNEVDFLFIDGDHTYDGVKKDFEMYSTLVRRNGIIAFHDIVPYPSMTGFKVNTYWNEIKSGYEHTEIVEDWNQEGKGIGLIKNAVQLGELWQVAKSKQATSKSSQITHSCGWESFVTLMNLCTPIGLITVDYSGTKEVVKPKPNPFVKEEVKQPFLRHLDTFRSAFEYKLNLFQK